MKGHLLITGNEPNMLIDLCLDLRHYFSTTTVGATDDVVGRTMRGVQEGFDAVVVVLDGWEEQYDLHDLFDQNILFVASDPASRACSRLRAGGGLVVNLDEPEPVLQASLFIVAGRQARASMTNE